MLVRDDNGSCDVYEDTVAAAKYSTMIYICVIVCLPFIDRFVRLDVWREEGTNEAYLHSSLTMRLTYKAYEEF